MPEEPRVSPETEAGQRVLRATRQQRGITTRASLIEAIRDELRAGAPKAEEGEEERLARRLAAPKTNLDKFFAARADIRQPKGHAFMPAGAEPAAAGRMPEIPKPPEPRPTFAPGGAGMEIAKWIPVVGSIAEAVGERIYGPDPQERMRQLDRELERIRKGAGDDGPRDPHPSNAAKRQIEYLAGSDDPGAIARARTIARRYEAGVYQGVDPKTQAHIQKVYRESIRRGHWKDPAGRRPAPPPPEQFVGLMDQGPMLEMAGGKKVPIPGAPPAEPLGPSTKFEPRIEEPVAEPFTFMGMVEDTSEYLYRLLLAASHGVTWGFTTGAKALAAAADPSGQWDWRRGAAVLEGLPGYEGKAVSTLAALPSFLAYVTPPEPRPDVADWRYDSPAGSALDSLAHEAAGLAGFHYSLALKALGKVSRPIARQLGKKFGTGWLRQHLYRAGFMVPSMVSTDLLEMYLEESEIDWDALGHNATVIGLFEAIGALKGFKRLAQVITNQADFYGNRIPKGAENHPVSRWAALMAMGKAARYDPFLMQHFTAEDKAYINVLDKAIERARTMRIAGIPTGGLEEAISGGNIEALQAIGTLLHESSQKLASQPIRVLHPTMERLRPPAEGKPAARRERPFAPLAPPRQPPPPEEQQARAEDLMGKMGTIFQILEAATKRSPSKADVAQAAREQYLSDAEAKLAGFGSLDELAAKAIDQVQKSRRGVRPAVPEEGAPRPPEEAPPPPETPGIPVSVEPPAPAAPAPPQEPSGRSIYVPRGRMLDELAGAGMDPQRLAGLGPRETRRLFLTFRENAEEGRRRIVEEFNAGRKPPPEGPEEPPTAPPAPGAPTGGPPTAPPAPPVAAAPSAPVPEAAKPEAARPEPKAPPSPKEPWKMRLTDYAATEQAKAGAARSVATVPLYTVTEREGAMNRLGGYNAQELRTYARIHGARTTGGKQQLITQIQQTAKVRQLVEPHTPETLVKAPPSNLRAWMNIAGLTVGNKTPMDMARELLGWRERFKASLETEAARPSHRRAIEKAIKEGKDVPAEVLSDHFTPDEIRRLRQDVQKDYQNALDISGFEGNVEEITKGLDFTQDGSSLRFRGQDEMDEAASRILDIAAEGRQTRTPPSKARSATGMNPVSQGAAEKEAEYPDVEPAARGKLNPVVAPKWDEEIAAQVALVELSDLHEAAGKMYQPRKGRGKRVAYSLQEQENAQKWDQLRAHPARVGSTGPIIITTKGAILSGHGRSRSLDLVYEKHPEREAAIRKDLAESAAVYGWERADAEAAVARMKRPVVVQIVDVDKVISQWGEEKFKRWIEDLNRPEVASSSTQERAAEAARRLDAGLFSFLPVGVEDPRAMLTNPMFVRKFFEKIQITKEELGGLTTEKGELNEDGYTFIKRAIFAWAYGDNQALRDLTDKAEDVNQRLTVAALTAAPKAAAVKMLVASGDRYRDLDMAKNISEAMQKYGALKEAGTKAVEDYLNTPASLFEGEDPVTKTLVMLMHDSSYGLSKSGKRLADFYSAWADVIDATDSPKQGGIDFGVGTPRREPPNPHSVLQAAYEVAIERARERGEFKKGRLKDETPTLPEPGREGGPPPEGKGADERGAEGEPGALFGKEGKAGAEKPEEVKRDLSIDRIGPDRIPYQAPGGKKWTLDFESDMDRALFLATARSGISKKDKLSAIKALDRFFGDADWAGAAADVELQVRKLLSGREGSEYLILDMRRERLGQPPEREKPYGADAEIVKKAEADELEERLRNFFSSDEPPESDLAIRGVPREEIDRAERVSEYLSRLSDPRQSRIVLSGEFEERVRNAIENLRSAIEGSLDRDFYDDLREAESVRDLIKASGRAPDERVSEPMAGPPRKTKEFSLSNIPPQVLADLTKYVTHQAEAAIQEAGKADLETIGEKVKDRLGIKSDQFDPFIRAAWKRAQKANPSLASWMYLDRSEANAGDVKPPEERRAAPGPRRPPGGKQREPASGGQPEPRRPDGGRPRSVRRIITARAEQTRPADEEVVPEDLREHLIPEQIQGAAKAIGAMERADPKQRDSGGFILADGAGAGKTSQALTVAEHFRRKGNTVVIVAPPKVLAPAKAGERKGYPTGSYASDSERLGVTYTPLLERGGRFEPGKINVTSYQRFTGTAEGAFFERVDSDTILIFDECFAARTLVDTPSGPKPIESILPGDVVLGALGPRRVRRSFRKTVDSRSIVTLTIQQARISCTLNHKFLTDAGWVQALDLTRDHRLIYSRYAEAILENLRPVPADLPCEEVSEPFLRNVLRSEMENAAAGDPLSSTQRKRVQQDLGVTSQGTQAWRRHRQTGIPANASAQPDEVPSNQAEGLGVSALVAASADDARRERTGSDTRRSRSSADAWAESRLELPSCPRSEEERISDSLQGGRCYTVSEISHRGGRFLPPSITQERTGQEEGSGSRFTRLDGLAVLQYRDRLSPELGPSQVEVYDLEVEGHPSYSVNGLLVHNSHYLKNVASAQAIAGMEAVGRAKAVLFATATPGDKIDHMHFMERAGILEGHSIEKQLDNLGMERIEFEVPTKRGKKRLHFWAPKQSLGRNRARIVAERISALYDRLTEKGLMVKREVSMEGTQVGFHFIKLPKEAHDILDRISSAFPPQGRMRAVALQHMRRQQEPWKMDEAVRMAKESLDAGEQVIIFAARVNASEVAVKHTMFGARGEREQFREVIAQSEGTLKSLREKLRAAGIPDSKIAEIHGDAKHSSPEAQEKFNKGDAPILLATIAKAGEGINLDDRVGDRPRHMIIMTPPFSANENVQAIGRIIRMPTRSESRVTFLMGDTGTDYWNAGIIATKMKMLDAYVKGEVKTLDVPPEVLEALKFGEAPEEPVVRTAGKPRERPAPVAGKPMTGTADEALPIMRGASEKQIGFAEDIRRDFLSDVDTAIASGKDAEAWKQVRAWALTHTLSRWWINRKGTMRKKIDPAAVRTLFEKYGTGGETSGSRSGATSPKRSLNNPLSLIGINQGQAKQLTAVHEFVQTFADMIGMTVHYKHKPNQKNVDAYYTWHGQDAAARQQFADPPSIFHEAGHHMHNLIFEDRIDTSIPVIRAEPGKGNWSLAALRREAAVRAMREWVTNLKRQVGQGAQIENEMNELLRDYGQGPTSAVFQGPKAADRYTEAFGQFVKLLIMNEHGKNGAQERAPTLYPYWREAIGNRPELLQAVQFGKTWWENYEAGDAFSKLGVLVSTGESAVPLFSSLNDLLQTYWNNHNARLYRAVNTMVESAKRHGTLAKDPPPDQDPRILADQLPSTSEAAMNFLIQGTHGFWTRGLVNPKSGLKYAIEKVGNDGARLYRWNIYEMAERMKYLAETRADFQDTLATFGVDKKIIDEVVAQGRKDADFQETSRRVRRYTEDMLRYWRDAGFLSAEGYRWIKENNEIYTPLFNLYHAEPVFRGMLGRLLGPLYRAATKPIREPGRMGSLPEPIQAIHGSPRVKILPLESLVRMTFQMFERTEKNEVVRQLGALAALDPEHAKWVTEVPMHEVAQRVDVKSVLDKSGIYDVLRQQFGFTKAQIEKLQDEIPVDVVNLFHQSLFPARPQELWYWKDGQPRLLYVHDKMLFNTIQRLDRDAANLITGALGLPVKIAKAGISMDPNFQTGNIIRDVQTSKLLAPTVSTKGVSTVMSNPYKFRRAPENLAVAWASTDFGGNMLRMIGANDFADYAWNLGRKYKSFGGQAQWFSPRAFDIQRMAEDIFKLRDISFTPNRYRAKLRAAWHATMDAVIGVTEGTELASRLQISRLHGLEQARTRREMLEAIVPGTRVSLDFRQAGLLRRALNGLSLYFNPAWLGWEAFFRSFRRHPLGTAIRTAQWLVLPQLFLSYYNDQDERIYEVPSKIRNANWVFFLPRGAEDLLTQYGFEDPYVKIPKPQEFGIIATMVDATWEALKENDPEAYRRIRDHIDDQIPIELWGGVPIIPIQAIEPVAEVLARRKFFSDTPLIGESKMGKLPIDRFTRRTGLIPKLIAGVGEKARHYDPDAPEEWSSPYAIETLMEGYFPGLPMRGLRLADAVLREIMDLPAEPQKIADIPVVGRLMGQLGLGTETTDRMFQTYEKGSQAYRSYLGQLDPARQEQIYAEHRREIELYLQLKDLVSAWHDVNRYEMEDAITRGDENASRAATQTMRQIATEAKRVIQEFGR